MYKIYNCSFFELEKINGNYEPISFDVNSSMTNRFNIEELDSITSRYKSQEAFYNALVENKKIDGTSKNIIIVHKKNGKLYNDGIIYDDPLVAEISTQVKKNKKNNTDYVIKNSRSLALFLQYIEEVATSDQYKYLLDPKSVLNITSSDSFNLSSYIGKDIVVDFEIVKKRIKTLLEEYREIYLKNKEYIYLGYCNESTSIELDKLRMSISNFVRSDYKTFRNLVVWNNRYIKVLTKLYHHSSNSIEKLYYFKLIEDASMERDYWNGNIDEGQLYEYYDKYRNSMIVDELGQIRCGIVGNDKLNASIKQLINRI